MAETLEKESLITISIPQNKIYWIKKNKELLYQNRLFDVKSVKAVNGISVFKGLFDEEETKLIEKMKENGTGNFVHQNLLVAFFQLLMSSYCYSKDGTKKSLKSSCNYYTTKHGLPLSPCISFITPPPEI